MPQATIDRLIVNCPYEEPEKHWRYDRQARLFDLANGRQSVPGVVDYGVLSGTNHGLRFYSRARPIFGSVLVRNAG